MRKNHHFYKIALGFVFSILIITIVAGCAGKKSEKRDPFFEKWKARAENSKGYSPAARRRAIKLPGKTGEEAPGQERVAEPEKLLPTKKISMKMHNVDLAVLLRALARVANQNIIISEKVIAKVNINIKKAPWDQVFQCILRTHGLTYAWEGDVMRIMSIEDMEQDLMRESRKRELEMVEPLLTKVIKVNFPDANNLKENLEKFLTEKAEGKARGSVMVDSHTNSLIIQAIRSDIERMIPLIEELDRPTRQILIEAHIVETSRQTARELGIQWGGLYKSDRNNYWITPGANSTGVLDRPLIATGEDVLIPGIDPTSGMAVNFPAVVAGGTGLTLGFVAEEIGKSVLSVQLSALQKEGKLNILSSPSITTLDNQMAVIESGKEVPYMITTGENIGDIEYKDVVIKLEVTPYVIDEKTLKLKILTKKDDLDWGNAVSGNPAINKKKAETNVVLFNGQTTVIGGLSKENIDDSESGVPWLKDIPLLGYLFKGTSKSNTMEDVLIFITPHILEQELVE